MEATKVTIGEKTYDMNLLGKKKKTNLRRKLIVEYIQSKPAGEIIGMTDFQSAGRFNSYAGAYDFIKSMIKAGVISQYAGDKPRTYYYSVIGAIRVSKPADPLPEYVPKGENIPDFNAFIKDMKALGVKFTITIENK